MKILEAGARKLGLNLTPAQLEQFQAFYEELLAWNRRMNLTTIIKYDDVQLKHFLDSLTVISAFPSGSELRAIDVGTGAGLPGIPLKIALPDIRLTLLDSTAKKAEFVRRMVEKLGLKGVEIVVGRAEDMGHRAEYREKFDAVVSRAVAPLPTLAELCLPFCAVGGRFIAQKKGELDDEIRRAAPAISLLGGKLHDVRGIDLDELPDKRCLVIIEKVSATPDKYPRRPGIPSKRPIV